MAARYPFSLVGYSGGELDAEGYGRNVPAIDKPVFRARRDDDDIARLHLRSRAGDFPPGFAESFVGLRATLLPERCWRVSMT